MIITRIFCIPLKKKNNALQIDLDGSHFNNQGILINIMINSMINNDKIVPNNFGNFLLVIRCLFLMYDVKMNNIVIVNIKVIHSMATIHANFSGQFSKWYITWTVFVLSNTN